MQQTVYSMGRCLEYQMVNRWETHWVSLRGHWKAQQKETHWGMRWGNPTEIQMEKY